MADPWTSSQDGEVPPKPFDRRALEATLADAVRTVEVPDSQAGEQPALNPSGLAVGGTVGTRVIPGPEVAKSAPAAAPAKSAPAPAAPAPTATAGDAAGPASSGRAPLNPFSKGQSPQESGSLLGAGPSRLANPLAGSLGGLRATSPENLGPINFSGTSSSLSDLSGNRSSSNFASAPVDRATIPIRRAPKAEPVADSAQAPAPAPAAPPAPRISVAIEAWNPSDDDILPRVGGARKSFRLKRS